MQQVDPAWNLPSCEWSAQTKDTYLAGCEENCKSFHTAAEAQSACEQDMGCGGVTGNGINSVVNINDVVLTRLFKAKGDNWQLRESSTPAVSPINESSYYITNAMECHAIQSDPSWIARGVAAYVSIST